MVNLVMMRTKGKTKRRKTKSRRDSRKMTMIIKNRPGPVMVSDTLCPAVHILGT